MTFGFYQDGEQKLIGISDELLKQLEENTWIIHDKNVIKMLGKSLNNPGIIPEKSQNISGNNTGNSPENIHKMTEKVLEKPDKLVVNKPQNSTNFDANIIEYCCKILEHLVVSDGGSIKLTNLGLTLKSNPTYPVFQLKYCPNCGTKIEQNAPDYVEKPVPEPKEILRDDMKNKPPN